MAVSAAVHTALAWARATPNYFPDEYIYSELGRSLAESGRPVVRGAGPLFAPILQPLVTAPAWLVDDVATAYRLVQAIDAVAMSLAVIPVYLIARRLRLGSWLALACAAIAVAIPDLLYASWMMSEPVAYPLSLAALAAALSLFERPTLRLQAGFIALAGLATLSRIQLAAIPLCYLLAVLATALRERGVQVIREQWLAFSVLGTASASAFALGLRGNFGYYASFTYVQADVGAALGGLGANALVLLYASGFVLVPGAILGLVLAVARPRSRSELGFAVLTVTFVLALLLQASLYADTAHVQQRYLFYGLPLIALAFALYASRGWPLRRTHLALAAAATAAASLVPLSGLAAAEGSAQSLVLLAVRQLELWLGDIGAAALVFALAANVLSLLGAAAAWTRPKWATVTALGLASTAFVALTATAFTFDRANVDAIRTSFLADDPSWVDASGAKGVTLMLSPRGLRTDAHSTLFWNRSVDRVVLFTGAVAPDAFAAEHVVADDAGRMTAAGQPITGPLLVDVYGMAVELRRAQRVGAGPTKTLWQPRGQAQLLLAMPGLFHDGWLSSDGGGVAVWPERPGGLLAGWFELDLTVPADGRPIRFRLDIRDGSPFQVTVQPGRPERLRLPVCRSGVWAAGFATEPLALANGRRVGPRSSTPRYVPDARACATTTPPTPAGSL